MNRNLERVMPHVFRHEGGYVDHPHDPGGATNLGVTLATLSAWRGRSVAKAELQALGRAEATEIYRRQYWLPVRGDELPGGVDYAVFDFAIHSGPRRAAEYLQRAAGVDVDGEIGIHTLSAVGAAEPERLAADLCAARLRFLKRIRNRRTGEPLWRHFGRGWQRRVDEVAALSRELAAAPDEKDAAVPAGNAASGARAGDLPDTAADNPSRDVPLPARAAWLRAILAMLRRFRPAAFLNLFPKSWRQS
jgi:lysozyme family protein